MHAIAYSPEDRRWFLGKLHKVQGDEAYILTKSRSVIRCLSVDRRSIVNVNDGIWVDKYQKHVVDRHRSISRYKQDTLRLNINLHGTSLYG